MTPEQKRVRKLCIAEDVMAHVEYLEDTLIPDLKESGRDFTAADFERCCVWLREYAEVLRNG